MGLRTLAFVYLFGGLTFLPLLVAVVLTAAWKFLPQADTRDLDTHDDDGDGSKLDAKSEELARKAKEDRDRQESIGDAAASGTFAVLRRYDFQAAIGALNARNNASGNGSTANVAADATTPGDGASASMGESVYQSMYRSVFVGKQNNSSTQSLLQQDATLRKPVPASVVYIVLRHGHLMLYDSPAQIEVKHVLSLAHHKVSLQAGQDGDDADEKRIPESDLFIKRTAIVLTPVELPNGALQQQNAQPPPKPFYLFSATNFDKEDFYHALLFARSKPPTPRPLDVEALIKLQSALHSSSLTPETRALNALLGRVFLGVHHGQHLIDFIRTKIERKLNRIQKPTFIPSLRLRSLDLGDAGPVFTNLKLRDLNISGDTTISADMRYNGGLSLTLLAVAKLDLGPRFKTRTVDLVLKTSIRRVQGTMLLHIKPPPSNRIWFTFESTPDLEVRVEPVVSDRKITYGFILRAIEERLRSAIAEGLVKPNWDDIPMPMQDTRGSHARGGLWSDEGQEDHVEPSFDSAKFLAERNQKTISVPDLKREVDTATSSSLWSNSELNVGRLRHASTMPVNADAKLAAELASGHERLSQGTPRAPRPLRSPSMSSGMPSVAVSGESVEPVRSNDPALQPSPQSRKLWRPRGNNQPQQKDAVDELRDLRDRANNVMRTPSSFHHVDIDENAESDPTNTHADTAEPDDASIRSRRQTESDASTIGYTTRSVSLLSADSDRAFPTTPSPSTTQQRQNKKANLIAAAGAATNAARNWGWNTYQKNKNVLPRVGASRKDASAATKEPMGRGQPLPPPGQPLPGPQKGIWGSVNTMRRKPVPNLPPRPTKTDNFESDQTTADSNEDLTTSGDSGSHDVTETSAADDEFDDWQENVVTDSEWQRPDSSQHGDSPYPSNSERLSAAREDSNKGTMDEDLLDSTCDDTKSEVRQPALVQFTPLMPKRMPPPLPARPGEHRPGQAPSCTSEGDTNADQAAEQRGDTEGEPLKVPESAAGAIAAENTTSELAHGTADELDHVDHESGVDTEILPNRSVNTWTASESLENLQAPEPTLSRNDLSLRHTTTEERFRRGENVHEEDFEHDQTFKGDETRKVDTISDADHGVVPSRPEASHRHFSQTAVPMNLPKDDELARRIKAAVQKHESAGAAGGNALQDSDITPATGW